MKTEKASVAPPDGKPQFTTSILIVLLFPELGPIIETRAQVSLETPVNRLI
jgi:hypothetical protein